MNKPYHINSAADLQREIDKLKIKREILLEGLGASFNNLEWSDIGSAVGHRLKGASPIALAGTGGIAISALMTAFRLVPKLWLLNKARKLVFR